MGNTNATSASSQSRINNSFSSTQPVVFHNVHGDNIRLEQNSSVARRVESFCKAIVFSSRPIQVNEKVMIKLTEISSSWSGALRLGFTSHDPVSLQNNMPKYACPDLTNRPGNWAKALGERYAVEGAILHYFVNSSGEAFFGIDGEEKGMLLSGVDTSVPLWALIDIYGNTTTIEMVDQVRLLNNHQDQVRSVERMLPDLSLRLTDITLRPVEETPLASPTFSRTTHFFGDWIPMDFHRVMGPNAKFQEMSRCIAARTTLNAGRALVFSARRLETNEKCLVEITATNDAHSGSLTFGLTTCDPATLQQWASSFPEDPECLMDRPEYWVVKKNVVASPNMGDEISFVINDEGMVLCSVNNKHYDTIMYVDATQKFYMFFDIAGCVTELKLLGTSKEGPVKTSVQEELPTAECGPTQPDSAQQQEEDTDCKICFENPIESAFCNCGHSMTCHDCGMKLFKSRDPQCPMCRQPIVNVIKIFRA
ncbi:protein neuralized-like isoform X2 [Ornithodoros turicata]|uniref:protein neuralized-like isoform X2 n=1 Tax=Ornithodoros turicata TaxID=34597 RepID=UPI003139B73F